MPLTRPTALAIVAAAAGLVASRSALAVCNVPNACHFADVAACCGATTCTLDGTVTIGGATCDIDFGARNVTLAASGTINLGSNTLSIKAGSFTVTGVVNGQGTSPNRGGRLVVTTSGGTANAFRITNNANALINLSGYGDGGGSLEVHADGPIGLTSGAITASALENAASGGSISIDTSAGDVTVAVPVQADSGVNGTGGFVEITAKTNLTVTDSGVVSAASGGSFGGEIDLTAGGALTVSGAATIVSTALNNSAGDGGDINLTAGSVNVQGMMASNGGGDPTKDAGGAGGSISIEADTGALTLTRATGFVATVDGAGGGDGGLIDLTTVSPTAGALTIGAAISANGTGGITKAAGGGEIDATSAAGLTVGKSISVTGVGSGSGIIDFFGQNDVLIQASINGSDPGGGGALDISSGHDLVLNDVGLGHNLKWNATSSGDGGQLGLAAGNDLTITGFVLDVSGAGTGAGQNITLTAGRKLTIAKTTLLSANSGAGSNREAGTILIAAGFPDLAGDLQIDGDILANGHAPGAVASPASIQLSGCLVTISSTGLVDSTGDPGATNTVTARKGITIAGKLKTTSQNVATYPTGTCPGGGGQVSPAFASCPAGAKPLCTAPNTPAGCLVPCPVCGNLGAPEFPEQCDPPGCPNCDQHCRHFSATGCADNNPCTTDSCTTSLGYPSCSNIPSPTGTPCDDATVCNGHETCHLAGVDICAADMGLDCDDGNPCTTDSCNAQTGCAHAPITGPPPAGATGCTDRCAQTCNNGTCITVTPPNCNDNDPTTRDSCNPATGMCVHAPAPPCSSAAQCDDSNPCTSDTCVSGTCHNDPNDALPCSDGNVCNGVETCHNGVCTPGTPLPCNDGDPCTDDTCDPIGGCPHPAVPNCCHSVTDCGDGNACTADSCVANVCHHDLDPNCCATDADCNDGNPCTMDSACVNSTCTHAPLSGAHAGCGDACHPNAACQSGACVLGTMTTCTPSTDPCTQVFCDPFAGCTSHRIDGCCTGDGDCPHDACTTGGCDPGTHTCVTAPLFLGCKTCSVDTDCDPLGACGQETCDTAAGVCRDHTAPNCTDGNPKTVDSCVVDGPGQAHCEHACTCDDHNACNGVETCSATGCTAGTPLVCDDGDGCTDDTCDPKAGCTHTPRTGFASVRCRLDAIALALQQAPGAAVTAPVRARVSRLLGKARTKLDAAEHGSGKRAAKALKMADNQLKAITNGVAAARKRNKIDGGLADTITTAAKGASAALETLKTAVTP